MYGAHAHIKMGVFSLKITISQTIDIYQYFLNIILSSLLYFEKSEKVQIVSINICIWPSKLLVITLTILQMLL